jgi:23S rRNA pseudouridine1911/1915/1917 synthase
MAVVDAGRPAITDFRVRERIGAHTLLEVHLRTGRTHQIRVHLAYIRRPVAGDPVYGKPHPRMPRPALHAARLTFVHPYDRTRRTYDSPLARDIVEFLAYLRRQAS